MSMEIGWLAGKKTKKKIERTKSNRIIKDIFEEYLKKKGKLCEPHHLIVVKERNQDGAFYTAIYNTVLENIITDGHNVYLALYSREGLLKCFKEMKGSEFKSLFNPSNNQDGVQIRNSKDGNRKLITITKFNGWTEESNA